MSICFMSSCSSASQDVKNPPSCPRFCIPSNKASIAKSPFFWQLPSAPANGLPHIRGSREKVGWVTWCRGRDPVAAGAALGRVLVRVSRAASLGSGGRERLRASASRFPHCLRPTSSLQRHHGPDRSRDRVERNVGGGPGPGPPPPPHLVPPAPGRKSGR